MTYPNKRPPKNQKTTFSLEPYAALFDALEENALVTMPCLVRLAKEQGYFKQGRQKMAFIEALTRGKNYEGFPPGGDGKIMEQSTPYPAWFGFRWKQLIGALGDEYLVFKNAKDHSRDVVL